MRHILVLLHVADDEALFEFRLVGSQPSGGEVALLLGGDDRAAREFAGRHGKVHAAHDEAEIDAEARSVARDHHAVSGELLRNHRVAALGHHVAGIFDDLSALNQRLFFRSSSICGTVFPAFSISPRPQTMPRDTVSSFV